MSVRNFEGNVSSHSCSSRTIIANIRSDSSGATVTMAPRAWGARDAEGPAARAGGGKKESEAEEGREER
jgi:hypothetical protein